MINIGEALRANLRAALSVDTSGALHLRLSYGPVTLCDAEVDLPVASVGSGSIADERGRIEADLIAEARAIADSHGRATARATLAAEAGRQKIVDALGLERGVWTWQMLADAIRVQQAELRALKAEGVRLKALRAVSARDGGL